MIGCPIGVPSSEAVKRSVGDDRGAAAEGTYPDRIRSAPNIGQSVFESVPGVAPFLSVLTHPVREVKAPVEIPASTVRLEGIIHRSE
jgi:hypothetical protein